MPFLSRALRANFWIRLRKWEYWPFGIIHFPYFLYWLWLSLRARSLVFFSASNPGIVMGGMFGESKYDVLKIIPPGLLPMSILISGSTAQTDIASEIKKAGMAYPVIAKPVYGERGWMVQRIDSEAQLKSYSSEIKMDFILQEFIDLPEEYSVFYVHYPSEPKGFVRSLVGKEMLFVEGDGKSTLRELILSKDRAKLQWKRLREKFADQLGIVLEKGKRKELGAIGNHSLGTKFIDCGNLINPMLNETFNRISSEIDGFYFGRFDLRCRSFDDLVSGKVKIMELNGCGSEPIQIYDPDFPLARAFKVMTRHWNDLYRISVENHRHGIAYTSFREGLRYYRQFRKDLQRS